MTSNARPNLGGLFNGSAPPQRPSRGTDPQGPRLVTSVPILDPTGASTSGGAEHTVDTPDDLEDARTPMDWADPVTLVNEYFRLLRRLLDANQQWALACANAVVGLPLRVGIRR